MVKSFKIRDFRKKGFFMMDNEYLDNYAKHLDPHATVVYLSLCRHADIKQSAFPAQKTIATQHGIGERTVRDKLNLLQEFNIIKIKKTRNKEGKWERNIYHLVDRSEWKAPSAVPAYGKPSATDCNEPSAAPADKGYQYKKETHNTPKTPPNGKKPKTTRRQNNRLAGKPYNKPDWLLKLTDEEVAYFQEEFTNMPADRIRREAKASYYWQKDKKRWKKDNRSFLRNWLRNKEKWDNENRKSSYHQQ